MKNKMNVKVAEIRTVWLCTTDSVYTTPLESLAKLHELEETSLPHLRCSDKWPQLFWRLFWKVVEAMPIQVTGTTSYILNFSKGACINLIVFTCIIARSKFELEWKNVVKFPWIIKKIWMLTTWYICVIAASY